MKAWSLALIAAILVVSGPAWAKGKGGGHGGGHGQGDGQDHENDHGRGHSDESTLPEGALPPGLAKKDELPKGLEKQDKTPAGWEQGKKKGWWQRIFGAKED